MADLPRIFARPNLPDAPGLPRYTPDSFGVGAFNSFGVAAGALAESFQKIEDASVEAESRRLIQDTQAQIEDAIRQGDANEVDPDSYHENTSRGVRDIYSNNLNSTKNPRVQERFRNALSPFLIKSQTAIDLDRTKKKVAMAEANFAQYLDGAGQRLSRLDDPVERAQLEKEIVDVVQAAVRTQTIKPKDAVTTITKIRDQAQDERVAWKILNDPAGLIEILKNPNELPSYTGSKRVAAEQRALEALRERRVAGERAEKERQEGYSMEYLDKSSDPQASLTAVREQIRNDKRLDFGTKRFWLDRMDQRINAAGAGEPDPFFKSDGQVYAHVLTGILNEPDKWTKADITRYAGRGLSVDHVKSLTKEWEDRTSGKSGGSEAKKQALATWERMRREGFFLPADRRTKKPSMQDILRNDAAAQEVWDAVMEDARKGGDHRVILQEKMRPFHDAEVKGFFSRMLSGVAEVLTPPFLRSDPNVSRETEADAVEFLMKNRRRVTEKNIRAFQEHRATKTTPAPAIEAGSAAAGAVVGGMGEKSETPGALPAVQKNTGSVEWDRRSIGAIQDWFTSQFGQPLPVTAEGMSETHARLGFQHGNAVDVGLSPNSEQGRALVNYLRQKGIPFIAFDRAIPGQSTGPHIHIGKPSQRVARLPTAGN